jgi:hypothetical protein
MAMACGREGAAAARATVRDSAGVQIVENHAPLWSPKSGWHLSATPLVSIGVVEGDPHYQFGRVMRAIRLSDRRIVVADGGANELRFYSPDGRYLSTSGREGGGPGEFQQLDWIERLPGDSVVAFDLQNRRVSVFDSTGRFARSSTITQAVGGIFVYPFGRFADGSLAMRTGFSFVAGETKLGVASQPMVVLHLDVDAAHADTIGEFPGAQWFVYANEHSTGARGLPFGRHPVTAVSGNSLYYGSSDRYEIGVYSRDGTLRRSIRRARENLPVTDDDIEALKQHQLQALDDGSSSNAARARIEREYAETPHPEHMPAYDRLIVDDRGNLWVEDYRRPADTQPVWTVFDSTGQMLGSVPMPERFRPFEIGADYVLGSWRDELDVQYVRLFGIERGEES